MAKENKKYCYACTKLSVSREHIPSQSFFPVGFRNNLITVPSFKKHNQDNSNNNEYVRNIITTYFQGNNYAYEQFNTKSLKSIVRNKRLINKTFGKAEQVIMNGEITGSITIDVKLFKKIYGLLGLGLYYHDYKKRFNHRFDVHPASLFFNKSATEKEKSNYNHFLNMLDRVSYEQMPCHNPEIFTYYRFVEDDSIIYKTIFYEGFIVYLEYLKKRTV